MKVLALATVAFVALLSGPLGATTIYVDCDNTTGPWDGSAAHPYLHIQDGINAAVNGDTVLVAAGTYTGSGNRDLDFGGKAITVRSADPTDPAVVAATIIDCEASDPDQHRAFNFHSGETSDSILNGLTIRGGYVSGNYAAGRGGGIYCESSDPTIVNMVITGCSADHGGGICCMTASPTIVNCLIRENEGEDSGGGIASYSGSPTISGCTIGDNWTSFDSGGGLALSMHTGGDPVVTDCVITGNGATHHGGGIYFFSDAAGGEIRGCTITENVAGRGGPNGQSYGADGDGGGIYCSANTNPAITDCTIQENQAVYDGGGVYCASNSTPIFTDCTILGNWSRNGDGGGLCLGEAAPQLARCSVWRNEAGGGGGAHRNEHNARR